MRNITKLLIALATLCDKIVNHCNRLMVTHTSKLKILRIKERRAYRDGIKRKGDKIGMVSVVSSKMRLVSEEL